ncbi:MAG: hypothetical protein U0165_11310 [Polyangiaceae bacterium]
MTSVNRKKVQEVYFSYVEGGQSYQASSCTRSSSIYALPPGSPLSIEISTVFPSVARIQNTTVNSAGYIGLFVMIFPGVGFLLFVSSWLANRREIRAFTHGTPTVAQVVSVGFNHSAKQNGKHPFEIVWKFSVNGQEYQGALSNLDPTKLQDLANKQQLVVLYDPQTQL